MRMFEILDQLNLIDTETGSANVGICNQVVEVKKNGNNGTITIGVPGEIAQELALGSSNKRVILLIVDMDAYNKIIPIPLNELFIDIEGVEKDSVHICTNQDASLFQVTVKNKILGKIAYTDITKKALKNLKDLLNKFDL
jgi:hypothetical protein